MPLGGLERSHVGLSSILSARELHFAIGFTCYMANKEVLYCRTSNSWAFANMLHPHRFRGQGGSNAEPG